MSDKTAAQRDRFEASMSVPSGVFWSDPDSRYMTTSNHFKCIEYNGKWLGWQSASMSDAAALDTAPGSTLKVMRGPGGGLYLSGVEDLREGQVFRRDQP